LIESIQVLGPFWKIEAYGGLIDTLKGFGYEEGQDLFVFPYDWRLSNQDNAERLALYIESLKFEKIDIVAHSMGGLISAIYLQSPSAQTRVNKIIFLGTPFLGSMNALGTLSNGYGGFQNAIAGGLDVIRRTALSFPALIELLPSYDACCRIGTAAQYEGVDPMSIKTWQENHWLPKEYLSGPRLEAFERNLERSRVVHEIVKKPISPNVQSIRIASDVFSTDIYLWASKADPGWNSWTFTQSRGDQTVLAWSAANDTSTLAGTLPSFNVHGTLFNDAAVRNILEREFVNASMPRLSPLRVLTDLSGIPRPFEFIDASLASNAVLPGQSTEVRLRVNWGAPAQRGLLKPTAILKAQSAPTEIQLVETSTDDDLSKGFSSFTGQLVAPSVTGSWPVEFSVGGITNDGAAVLTTYVPN
jgi:hypothetical protein